MKLKPMGDFELLKKDFMQKIYLQKINFLPKVVGGFFFFLKSSTGALKIFLKIKCDFNRSVRTLRGGIYPSNRLETRERE